MTLPKNLKIKYSVVLLTLMAIVTRFYSLGKWEFWFDEIYTVRDAALAGMDTMFTPRPLHYLLFKVPYDLFGVSEWSLRFVPALMAVLTIPLFYLSIKKIVDESTAFILCLIIIFSPWHLFHSQSARDYTFIFLLSGLSSFWFFKGITSNNNRAIILSFTGLIVAVLTHTSAIFILPAFITFAVINYFISKKKVVIDKRVMAVGTVITLLSIPFVYSLAKTWMANKVSWGYSFPHFVLSALFQLGLPISIMAVATMIYMIYNNEKLGYFLACYVAIPLLEVLVVGRFLNTRPDYIFSAVPGLFLLASIGCSKAFHLLKKDGQQFIALGLICALIGSMLPSFISHFQDGSRHQFKAATGYIEQQLQPNDYVLVQSPQLLGYYLKNKKLKDRILRISTKELDRLIGEKKGIWMIMPYSRSGMETANNKMKSWIYENCKMSMELIKRRFDYSDNSVRIFKCYGQSPTLVSIW